MAVVVWAVNKTNSILKKDTIQIITKRRDRKDYGGGYRVILLPVYCLNFLGHKRHPLSIIMIKYSSHKLLMHLPDKQRIRKIPES